MGRMRRLPSPDIVLKNFGRRFRKFAGLSRLDVTADVTVDLRCKPLDHSHFETVARHGWPLEELDFQSLYRSIIGKLDPLGAQHLAMTDPTHLDRPPVEQA